MKLFYSQWPNFYSQWCNPVNHQNGHLTITRGGGIEIKVSMPHGVNENSISDLVRSRGVLGGGGGGTKNVSPGRLHVLYRIRNPIESLM